MSERSLTVSGNPVMSGALALASAGIAIAYAVRALSGESAGDLTAVAVAGVFGVVAIAWLLVCLDSLTPRMVVDEHGVRIRFVREWVGLSWADLDGLSVRSGEGWLKDGRLTPQGADRAAIEGLGRMSRMYAALMQRLFGNAYAVPVGWSTRIVGGEPDLTTAVARLSSANPVEADVDPEVVADVTPEDAAPRLPNRFHDPRPALAAGIGSLSSLIGRPREMVTARFSGGAGLAVVGSNALAPEEFEDTEAILLPEIDELRRPMPELDALEALDEDPPEELTHVINLAPAPDNDTDIEPAEQQIGHVLAAARLRLSLSVDQLSDRTRIRPHVIESIESEDFGPCGGDFYARGHLRTLCRVLGVDAAPLVAVYDSGFAQSEIGARQVFQADLARHGSLRTTRGGTHWSLLVAAVMALVLAWSIARLVMDSPVQIQQPAPLLNGSAGPNNATKSTAAPLPVKLTAERGVRVVVRDGSGAIVFRGNLAIDETKVIDAVPPVRVSATEGDAVTVSVSGEPRGTIGTTAEPGSATFLAPAESSKP